MKVKELIALLIQQDPTADVEIETNNTQRQPDPLAKVERWRGFGMNTVVLRTHEHIKLKWPGDSDVVDMEVGPRRIE